MTETHGLYKQRPRTCPCGAVFTAKKPQATYCSNLCRVTFTRWGRTYGQHEPRELKVWRS